MSVQVSIRASDDLSTNINPFTTRVPILIGSTHNSWYNVDRSNLIRKIFITLLLLQSKGILYPVQGFVQTMIHISPSASILCPSATYTGQMNH